jgi:hypothetical protein
MTGPFFDGYADGLYDTQDHAHLYPEGRQLEKYADGVQCGTADRLAGALEPAEPLS